MSVLDDLRRLSAAEDIFKYLEVEFEPQILNVARLHILRRMGEYLSAESSSTGNDTEARARCKTYLQTAYADFLAHTPMQERVFKVHKDAVRMVAPRAEKQVFVPLASLSSSGAESRASTKSRK